MFEEYRGSVTYILRRARLRVTHHWSKPQKHVKCALKFYQVLTMERKNKQFRDTMPAKCRDTLNSCTVITAKGQTCLTCDLNVLPYYIEK